MSRRYNSYNEELKRKLLKRLFIALIVPGLFLGSFLLLGSKLGIIFDFISPDVEQVNTNNVKLNQPILLDIPEFTNSKTIKVKGHADGGVNVKLFVNGPGIQDAITTSDGEFTFEEVTLINGKNTIYVKSYKNNAESIKSETYNVIVDTEKPEIEIESPKNNSTIKNLDFRVRVYGKVNEPAEIKVNDRLAVQKPDYSFEILLGISKEGKQKLKIEATDRAGNTAEEEIEFTYLKQSN